MGARIIFGMVAVGFVNLASAQLPVITSFTSDGTLTWSNAYDNTIASIEQLTDVTTTGSAVTVTETLAVSDGSTAAYDYTVTNPPIANPSVTISDGTYSWNDVTGYSTNPPGFIGWVEYPAGTVHVDYPLQVPVAGTTIQMEYTFLPVSVTQEWLSVHSEVPTSGVSQVQLALTHSHARFRVNADLSATPG